jgi:hypothetical protein
MAVYLGNVGDIEIRRESIEGFKESVVNPSDVNAVKNRFSFDFEEGVLITGDLLEISTTDGTDLDFVDASGWTSGVVDTSGNWYIYVDQLGGVRLYSTFDESLDGGPDGLVSLNSIARDIPIRVSIRDRDSRILGSITQYELNTNRETVDITGLSEEYRQQISSLISGSGRIEALWDYVEENNREPVNYLMQLVLRTEIGSNFKAKLYIKSENSKPSGGNYRTNQIDDSLWWEFDALVTDSSTRFEVEAALISTIDFVATGPIKLRSNTQVPDYLLQEDGFKLSLEQDGSSYIALEDSD